MNKNLLGYMIAAPIAIVIFFIVFIVVCLFSGAIFYFLWHTIILYAFPTLINFTYFQCCVLMGALIMFSKLVFGGR